MTMYELNLAFTVVLFGVITAGYLASRQASVFHPATYYLFFHGLVFVVRPVLKYAYDFKLIYSLYKFWPAEETQNLALAVANLGFISFMAAVLLIGRTPFYFTNLTAGVRTSYHKVALLIATTICAPLFGLSAYYAANQSTDFERTGMIRDFSTMTAINTGNIGYLVDANQMMGPISVLIAWTFRFKPAALLPFACFVLFRMYVGWGRWTFIMATASLGLLFLYHTKRKWPTMQIVALGLGVLVAFHAIGQSRSYVRDAISGTQTVQRSTPEQDRNPLDNMDFANLEYLEYILNIVPERTGTYDYFLRNLQVFTEPIPRALWPGKPVGPPIQLYNIYQYGFPIGITWTLVGEGWQDLGVFGVIAWCGMAGALLGWLYEWFSRSDRTVFKIAFFTIMLPISVQWFRDGILLTAVKFPLFFVLPIIVWYVVYRVLLRHLPARRLRTTRA